MNEDNPVAKASPANESPSPVAPSNTGAVTKSHRARALRLQPFKPAMSSPPAPQIIDDTLEEDDLYVGIQVEAINRTEKLAGFKLVRTLYGGIKSQTLFKDLDKLLEEVYGAVAVKLNRKLVPKDEHEPAERGPKCSTEQTVSNHQGDGPVLTKPLPLPPDGMDWDEFLANLPAILHGGPRPAPPAPIQSCEVPPSQGRS